MPSDKWDERRGKVLDAVDLLGPIQLPAPGRAGREGAAARVLVRMIPGASRNELDEYTGIVFAMVEADQVMFARERRGPLMLVKGMEFDAAMAIWRTGLLGRLRERFPTRQWGAQKPLSPARLRRQRILELLVREGGTYMSHNREGAPLRMAIAIEWDENAGRQEQDVYSRDIKSMGRGTRDREGLLKITKASARITSVTITQRGLEVLQRLLWLAHSEETRYLAALKEL